MSLKSSIRYNEFLPSIESINLLCENKVLLKDTIDFIINLGDRLEKAIPISKVRYPDPFIATADVPNVDIVNDRMRSFKSDDKWTTVITSVIGTYVNTYPEKINRKIESFNRNIQVPILVNELKKFKAKFPDTEIKLLNKFDRQLSLIEGFLLTFILTEHQLSMPVRVYRGVSNIKGSPPAEIIKEGIELIRKISDGYDKIVNVDKFNYKEVSKLMQEYTNAILVDNNAEARDIILRFSQIPLFDWFSDKFIRENVDTIIKGFDAVDHRLNIDTFIEISKGGISGMDDVSVSFRKHLAKAILENDDFDEFINLPELINEKISSVNTERNLLFLKRLRNPGDKIMNTRLWSTSLNKDVATEEFSKGDCCTLQIDLPKGSNGLYIHGLINEVELLLPPCSVFKLVEPAQDGFYKLKYVSNIKKNTNEDWKLFIKIMEIYYSNTVVVEYGEDMYSSTGSTLDEGTIKEMSDYLKCRNGY